MAPVERREWGREFDILFVIMHKIFLFETWMLKVLTFAICFKSTAENHRCRVPTGEYHFPYFYVTRDHPYISMTSFRET